MGTGSSVTAAPDQTPSTSSTTKFAVVWCSSVESWRRKQMCAYMHTWRASPFDNLYNTVASLLITGSLQCGMSWSPPCEWGGMTLSQAEPLPEQNYPSRSLVYKEKKNKALPWETIAGQNSFMVLLLTVRETWESWIIQMTAFLSWCHLVPLMRLSCHLLWGEKYTFIPISRLHCLEKKYETVFYCKASISS